MGFFEDLFKKDHVRNHPLLSGWRNAPKVREALEKHAQELNKEDLLDEFSEQDLKNRNPYDTGDRAPQDVITASINAVRDMVGQFEWPIVPKISFNNFKDVKKAVSDPSRIVSGLAIYNLEFKTKTGVKVLATVPVSISRGEVIPPSTFDLNGETYIFAQSSINDIVKNRTIYKLDPMRGQFDPPMLPLDRQQALSQRNTSGWSPVENNLSKQRQVRMSRFKGVPVAYEAVKKHMDEAMEEGKDSFPKQYVDVLQNYILEHVSVAEYDQWYPVLVNDGYVLNQYGKGVNRGRNINAQMIEDGREDQLTSLRKELGYVQEAFSESKMDLYYAQTENREDDVEEITKEMLEIYHYMVDLHEKIESLEGQRTGNIGIQSQFLEEDLDDVEFELLDSDSSEDSGNVVYSGTKTPIEPGDSVKFMGYDGMIRGNVVEIVDPYLIVKSKGIEYRVVAEDVVPLPGTFKKMWA
jgi:hypothetical protein